MSQDPDLRRSDGLRQRLYDLVEDDELSLEEKQRRALEIGRSYLDTETGYIQRPVDEETSEMVAVVGGGAGLPPSGTTMDRATTYCRRTLEATSPVALSDAGEQGWADDPGYQEHGLECYLGTTIFVRGEAYGTVCFASRAARSDEFTGEEKAFVELLARLLGREIETVRYEREIESRERRIERVETRRESLFRTAPDAVLLADLETGEVVDANPAATDLTGYERDRLCGMSLADLYPPADGEKYREELDRLLEGGAPFERFADGTPLTIRDRDGSEVPVEVSASTVELDGREHVQAIVRDVSERRERERELRLKNRAIDAASVGITIAEVDDGDFPLVYANEEFQCLTGYDRERMLGSDCRFLQGPDTAAAPVDEIREALAAKESVRTELLNYRADGTPFWNELTLTPIEGEAGSTVTHYVGFQQDVTERKRRERLIAVLNRVLRHNLRNDMNVVRGLADLIAGGTEDDVADLAATISDTATGLTELSEKARTLEDAVETPEQLERRDVVDDLESVAADLRNDYLEVDVSVDAPDGLAVMASDQLPLALRELGENAAKHAGSSTVRLEAEAVTDGVEVRVHDAGPGLDETERRVVENGEETPLEHGQGLGLWLVNWIVTGVGGDLTTTVDGGTTVTVRLPTDRERAGGVTRPRPAALCRHAE